jgi:hypothetical protein
LRIADFGLRIGEELADLSAGCGAVVLGLGFLVEGDVGGDVGGGGPGVEGGEGEAGLRGEGSEVEVGLEEGLEEGGILGGEVGELGLPCEHAIVWVVFGLKSRGFGGVTAFLRTDVDMRAQVVVGWWLRAARA